MQKLKKQMQKNVCPWQFSLWHQYRLQWRNLCDKRQVSTRRSEASGLPILQQSAILWQATDITITGEGCANPPPKKIAAWSKPNNTQHHRTQSHDVWPPFAVATNWTASNFSATVDLYLEHFYRLTAVMASKLNEGASRSRGVNEACNSLAQPEPRHSNATCSLTTNWAPFVRFSTQTGHKTYGTASPGSG